MTDEHANDVRLLDEQLVAYLDGELNADERRHIEELLATDEKVRRRLQEMEQTWRLLDDLDLVPAGGKFVESTLEMVAVEAGKDAEQFMADAPRQRRRRILTIVGGLTVAILAGFFAMMLFWPNPNRQLVEDFSVLENLDRYRPIGDVEFLQRLRDEGLFPKDEGETPVEPAAHVNESPDQRLVRIQGMTQAEKQHLARLQERFESLDQDQQQQLRRLDFAIRTDPDALVLWQIMGRYDEWLMTLPLFTRAELADMTTADRIVSVKKHLHEEQARGDRRALDRQDSDVLKNWLKELVVRHEKTLLKAMSTEERKRFEDSTPLMRQGMLSWQMWQSNGPGRPPALLTESDLTRLREKLSPKARERLASKSTNEQWQQVAGWMLHMMWQRPPRGQLSTADDQRLSDFFENQLNDEQRDRLLAMPGEEMQRELLQMYQRKMRTPEGSNWHNNRRLPPAAIRGGQN
jgi:hypothetical protein